nr:hypothetical protein [Tanacetum cinerariifolium]
MSLFHQRECRGCGQPCNGYYCDSCTCTRCGMTLFNGSCDNCIYVNGKPIICTACGSMVKGGLCLTCDFKEKFLYNCDPNAYSFDNSNYFPRPQNDNYLCNLCGNNSHDGYDCQQQFPFVHEQEPSYNQNYDETSDEVFQANHSIQKEESFENSSSNQEKEEPSQESDIHQLIEECSTEANDLIESALNSKLLLINSQRLHIMEQPIERGNRSIQSLQNFRVVHKSSISFKNTSQISSIHAIEPVLSTKEPEHLLSMGYEHLSITPETESDEVTESNAENLLPIPIYDDNFEDIEYVEASLFDPEIVSVEEENVVQQEEEEVNCEDISQIQDIVLREKLLSIIRLISNIESLNDNSTPDCVHNSFESDNSLLDNFSPEFKTFCDHSEETRSGNTAHADNSLPEYDSFCFEIEPDQERLINLMKNDIPDNSLNDPLLEEVDLFLFDDSIPPGIENIADDPEGDIRFLEELLIDDSILYHESSNSNFKDNPSNLRPPPEPPDVETDTGEEISVVMNDKDEDVDYSSFIFVIFAKKFSLLSAESEDTIFDLEPTNPTNANAEENNDNQAEHKFINPFCTPVQEVAESTSHNIVAHLEVVQIFVAYVVHKSFPIYQMDVNEMKLFFRTLNPPIPERYLYQSGQPRSDKESPKAEIDVDLIHVNSNEEEEESAEEMLIRRRRKKGKGIEEARNLTPPTPIRSPRTYNAPLSTDKEKL